MKARNLGIGGHNDSPSVGRVSGHQKHPVAVENGHEQIVNMLRQHRLRGRPQGAFGEPREG